MRVALTFDAEHPDRPHAPPGVAEEVLAILGTQGVTATFFLQGRWVEAYPHLGRRIAAEGHRIGSHSFYHVRMPLLSDEGIRADVLSAERTIMAVTGHSPKPWFRCPWGQCGNDDRVHRALTDLGYQRVGWTIHGRDWDVTRTADEVAQTILGTVARGERDLIVLMHTWPATVPPVLNTLIARVRGAGGTFVTVDALDLAPDAMARIPQADRDAETD
ncbi:MAG TPA: polysaccharide deacetylase family protein [bacterium]|jgi:peptidoglycan/xylan/chitin deacetylase (PgdA/CDA1 family)|nr:polysaccharide deacetylase family protein [bacterium]